MYQPILADIIWLTKTTDASPMDLHLLFQLSNINYKLTTDTVLLRSGVCIRYVPAVVALRVATPS